MKKINLGIVGCGDIAFYTALLSHLSPQIQLTACCDTNPDKMTTFGRRFRIRNQFADYRQLITSPDVDAVYLSIPHNLHYEMILASAQESKPVLVEKPITRTYEEGLRLLPQIQDIKVGVNYQYRYDRACYALARATQRGELGKINSIRINVPWHRTQSYFDNAPWHKSYAQAGGGTLITQGSHPLDIALWALGESPVAALGVTGSAGFDVEVDTLAHGIVTTAGGTVISLTSSMIAATEQPVTIEIYGDRGTGIYTKGRLPALRFRGTRPWRESPPARGVEALHRSLNGFANWILHDTPYLTPAQEAMPVLAAVDGIYRAVLSGKHEHIQNN